MRVHNFYLGVSGALLGLGCGCILAFLVTSARPLHAAGEGLEIRYTMTDKVIAGEKPKLTISPSLDVARLSLSLRRNDGKRFHFKAENIPAGGGHEFSWAQPKGEFHYTCSVVAADSAGNRTKSAFEFDVVSLPPLQIRLHKEACSVDERRLVLSANRGIVKIEGSIIHGDKSHLQEHVEEYHGRPNQRVTFRWSQPLPEETITEIRLKVYDADGFWSSIALTPFWIEIPHEEVAFEFGKWDIRPDEEIKLKGTLARIRKEMLEHGEDLEIRLYVAGYTDTVGSAADNLVLSRNRARSIGVWFKKAGLHIPIFYQGFGEDVLAVETPDETPEPRNRRALYILGSTLPAKGYQLPRMDWKRL